MALTPPEAGDDVVWVAYAASSAARPQGTALQRCLHGCAAFLGSYLPQVLKTFAGGLPTFVLMMALSGIIQGLGWLSDFDAWVVRKVTQRYDPATLYRSDSATAGASAGLGRIQQLEISAATRVRGLEQRNAPDDAIERVGGVAPIDRVAFAESLKRLAALLPDERGSRVLAIDVDVAPLAADLANEALAMKEALDALRRKVAVIAIAMSRTDPADRQARNDFMRSSCTRLHPDVSAPAKASDQPLLKDLLFASPRLFHQADQYPLQYLTTRLPAFAAGSPPEWPDAYPSLGNLIYLQRTRPDQRLTLTALCEQAHSHPNGRGDAPLLEDVIAAGVPVYDRYEHARFNWRLLDSPELRYTQVVSDASASGQPAGSAVLPSFDVRDLPDAGVLILSINGGDRHDKFDIAGVSPDPVGGAALHALEAMSRVKPLEDSTWQGQWVDLLVGMSFALPWAFCVPLLRVVRKHMPVLGAWLTAAVPAGLAVGCIYLGFELSARLMEHDIWANPAYLVLGLALDTYLEGWRQAHDVEKPASTHRPWYSGALFGLLESREVLRRGYGSKVVLMRGSYEGPGTSADVEIRAAQDGVPKPEMADMLLSTLAKWTVLIVGFWFIVSGLFPATH